MDNFLLDLNNYKIHEAYIFRLIRIFTNVILNIVKSFVTHMIYLQTVFTSIKILL